MDIPILFGLLAGLSTCIVFLGLILGYALKRVEALESGLAQAKERIGELDEDLFLAEETLDSHIAISRERNTRLRQRIYTHERQAFIASRYA